MQQLPNSPLRFTARNDYAFLSIVHPCTMERTSFGIAETSFLIYPAASMPLLSLWYREKSRHYDQIHFFGYSIKQE